MMVSSMSSQEQWRVGEDAASMLITADGWQWRQRIGDRKLLLFCQACYDHLPADAVYNLRLTRPPDSIDENPLELARWWASNPLLPLSPRLRADFVRDIVEDPYRPMAVSKCPKCHGNGDRRKKHGRRKMCRFCAGFGLHRPWRTPTISAMAADIYSRDDFPILPVLADALEDAGYPDPEPCSDCEGNGVVVAYKERPDISSEIACHGCYGVKTFPSELLSHLRSPSVHVRGCWALDIVLGRW
jgi:hypothetical protein